MKKEAIEFSPKEIELLTDKEVLPLKQIILGKLEGILSQLRVELVGEVSKMGEALPPYLLRQPGKISRGENFRSFSYRLLDYPSFFQKSDWLFFRTLIMWGHHISFHLMAKGDPLEMILAYEDWEGWIQNCGADTQVTLIDDPWDWIPQEGDERPLVSFEHDEWKEMARSLGFMKLSRYLPLHEYNHLVEEGLATWKAWHKPIRNEKINK